MADNSALSRRCLLGLFGAAAALPVLSACGSSVGGSTGGGTSGGGVTGGALKVGLVNSATALGVGDLLRESKKLLIVTNAGAEDVTAKARTPYIWRSSFTNGQIASAKSGLTDGVYATAPDYAAGSKVIGEAKPAFGKTSDYQPFLTGIQQSGAKATFCFFSGAEAITFVKQYQQFGLDSTIPLYGSGFLTEGSVLTQQGDAVLGVQTAGSAPSTTARAARGPSMGRPRSSTSTCAGSRTSAGRW